MIIHGTDNEITVFRGKTPIDEVRAELARYARLLKKKENCYTACFGYFGSWWSNSEYFCGVPAEEDDRSFSSIKSI